VNRKKRMKINNKHFNSYLAGLFEGDGFILCPKAGNTVGKPKIGIASHKKDRKFFEWLSLQLGYGQIEKGSSPNSIIFTIKKEEYIKDMCERIKNYLRTGKIERVNQVLNYYNLERVELDTSHILSNGWLAGMSDADSNFNVIISDRKKEDKTLKVKRINAQWRLEISTTTSNNISNLEISNIISEGLNTSVIMRTRKATLVAPPEVPRPCSTARRAGRGDEGGRKEKYHSIIIICFQEEQKNILVDYFTEYPLLTAKRNDYETWKLIRSINDLKFKTTSTEKKIELVEKALKLKNKMNNKNIHVNWEHLKDVVFIET